MFGTMFQPLGWFLSMGQPIKVTGSCLFTHALYSFHFCSASRKTGVWAAPPWQEGAAVPEWLCLDHVPCPRSGGLAVRYSLAGDN